MSFNIFLTWAKSTPLFLYVCLWWWISKQTLCFEGLECPGCDLLNPSFVQLKTCLCFLLSNISNWSSLSEGAGCSVDLIQWGFYDKVGQSFWPLVISCLRSFGGRFLLDNMTWFPIFQISQIAHSLSWPGCKEVQISELPQGRLGALFWRIPSDS
jgi:hypothetical protein